MDGWRPQIAAGERFQLNTGNYLPAVTTPRGNVVVPNISAARITEEPISPQPITAIRG